ncbi:MAG: hypothetical protein GY930_16015 [bacterium]|nr:hypothetical protein [bacterium]
MKATTHTELYRKYDEPLHPRPPVERILAWSGLRQSFRQKLRTVLTFTPSIIAALAGCMTVHMSFTLTELASSMDSSGGQVGETIGSVLGSVAENIYRFLQIEQFFALLTVSWFGSRLIADDRKLSANLLYFARPITPLRYIIGKMGTACTVGVLTLLLPTLLICAQASFSSPDWVFLTDNYGVIVAVFGYSALWIVVMSSVVLAISSCFKRKSLALMCIFVLAFMIEGISQVLMQALDSTQYGLLSLTHNLQAISRWLFHESNLITNMVQQTSGMNKNFGDNISANFMALGAMTLLSWIVLWRNVKRMEVVS